MVKYVFYIVFLLAVGVAFAGGIALGERDGGTRGGFVKGHVFVKFREDEVLRRVPNFDKCGLAVASRRLGLPSGFKFRETSVAKSRKLAKGFPADSREDLSLFIYVDLPSGVDEDEAVELLRSSPSVEYAEKDAIGWAGGTLYPTNDPFYSDQQWHLQGPSGEVGRIWAPEAWDFTTGSTNVIVAILDTGLDPERQDFWGRTVPGTNFVSNGMFIPPEPDDDNGHGTEVASILAMLANDAKNGVGVDWNCKIMPVKVLDKDQSGPLSYWYEGVLFAVDNGADIINLSASSPTASVAVSNAIIHAVSNGVTFVTIAGNTSTNGVQFPGSMAETITVGGITTTGTLWAGSSYGTNLDLVAPSTNIFSISSPTGAPIVSGTSFAAPMVSGAASLLLSLDPTLDPQEIRDLLCGGALDQVGSDTNNLPGWDPHYGWGQLNIYNSMRLLLTEIDQASVSGGTTVNLSWPCTGSATTNEPFGVIWTDDFTSTNWTGYSTNVTYTTERAHWSGGNSGANERYYRTFIKHYQSSWTN